MKKIILLCVALANISCANANVKIGNDVYSIKTDSSKINTLSTSSTTSKFLVNQRTGAIATLTGNLKVTLKNTTAQIIADRYGLTIVNDFKHLNLVFFDSLGQNVFDLKDNMEQDSDIQSVELDIVENMRRAN